jgi:alpha-L-arabinofuranosidase
MFQLKRVWAALAIGFLLLVSGWCRAQSNLLIFAESLTNGWQDYSYCTRNLANTAPVHFGNYSISATIASAWQGLQFYHTPFTNSSYGSLSFWINGGVSGGQQLQMYGCLGSGPTVQSARYHLNGPLANTWQQYTVPLTFLGVANATNFSGFAIQDSAGSAEATFYVDDIQLVTAAAPARVNVAVNAAQPVRTADARWFGMNTAIWDAAFNSTNTVIQFTNLGTRALRFPGGSASDEYHWQTDRSLTNTWRWATHTANFIRVFTNLNAQAMLTVNYGTGSANEAAAWVAYANAATTNTQALGTDASGTNWQTAGYWASVRAAAPLGTDDGRNFLRISRTAPVGFKYWEIGNECYGDWETDSNSPPHDPYTYASRANNYIALMKAVDPSIKIGVVAIPGDDTYANYANHPATNSRTGLTHNGWTPVVLATLKNLGVTPDFLVHHRYPQSPGGENDTALLQSATGWASDAALLRQEISDYFGAGGTNIELLCTENNSVSSSPGKQSTSLVNGLFYADSLAQLMQTEFNGLFWWNFRNGGVETNNNSSSLYGWRLYGDYGITEDTNYFPVFYIGRLMQKFVQPGDTVLTAMSDYSLLAAYATRRQNGALSLLLINKDPVNTLTSLVTVAGFVPATNGTIYSYGIPQDNAAQTGIGSPDIAQTNLLATGTNFTCAFAPYSASVFTLAPAAAKLALPAVNGTSRQVSFQCQGQPGAPLVIQTSTNLVNWQAVNTNTPASGQFNFTNAFAPVPRQFWRAMWSP